MKIYFVISSSDLGEEIEVSKVFNSLKEAKENLKASYNEIKEELYGEKYRSKILSVSYSITAEDDAYCGNLVTFDVPEGTKTVYAVITSDGVQNADVFLNKNEAEEYFKKEYLSWKAEFGLEDYKEGEELPLDYHLILTDDRFLVQNYKYSIIGALKTLTIN